MQNETNSLLEKKFNKKDIYLLLNKEIIWNNDRGVKIGILI